MFARIVEWRSRRLPVLTAFLMVATLLAFNTPQALAAPGVTVTPTTVGVTEDGGATPSDTYDVVLDELPSGEVTVMLDLGGSTEFTVDQSSLTFTTSNWGDPQTVTVTSVDDDIDDGNSVGAITHSASGGGYGSVVIDSVTVNVTDDDTAGALINDLVNFVEETGTVLIDTYNVALTSEPTGDVTFTMTVDPTDGIEVTAVAQVGGAGFLTFTPANWATPQTVLITAIDDDIEEPQVDVETIFHSATGGGYDGVMIASGTVNVFDTDVAGVTIDEGDGVDTEEGGATDTYSVVLDTEPTENVTISLSPQGSEATAAATVGGGTDLVFTSGNWFTPQFVTVTAVDDDVADGGTMETIDHTASSSDPFYDGFTIGSVTAAVTDDDVAGVLVTPTVVSATEGGSDGTYDVVLESEPTGTVTITMTPQGSEATAVSTVGSLGTLTFTPGNWETPQEVTVAAVDDMIVDGGTTETIDHDASGGGYDAVIIDSVTANISDNDAPDISFTGAPLVTEPDGTDTYVVSLTMAPSGGDVTVTLTDNSSEFDIDPVTTQPLVFNAGNWDTGLTVTVRATDDDVDDGQQSGTITHTPSGGGYDAVAPKNVTVTVNDDDTKGITVVESSGSTSVTEGGATDT
ncbi:MAG: Calx-beta domain-containing protein, partial [Acidimicrobiia bacterium]|nr:Calx-beta domain-containing protein [Acidimicrobiia bacterium]